MTSRSRQTPATVPAASPATVRAAAHVHSEWSDDGSWPLARIAATFGRARCQVVLMSEHSRGFTAAKWQEYVQACAAASTGRVTLVPGIEYGDDDDVVHVPVWGRVPFFGEAPPIAHLLAGVSEAGGTAVWAHPWRRDAWRRFDPAWAPYLGAVEVWNRKYDGVAPNRRSVELSRRHQARPFVALDFHNRRQLFPLSLALRLGDAGEPSRDAAALRPEPALTAAQAGTGAQAGTARCATAAPVPDFPPGPGPVGPDDVYAALSAGRFLPRALGLPLGPLTGGLPAAALRTLESSRRLAARLVG